MLGYETEYDSKADDNTLLELSKKQEAILLTRDEELYNRARAKNINSVLVTGEKEEVRLGQLVKTLCISWRSIWPRRDVQNAVLIYRRFQGNQPSTLSQPKASNSTTSFGDAQILAAVKRIGSEATGNRYVTPCKKRKR